VAAATPSSSSSTSQKQKTRAAVGEERRGREDGLGFD